jgi:hypothetical protein
MLYLQQQNIFLSEQAFGEYFLFPVIPDKFDCAQRVFKIYKKIDFLSHRVCTYEPAKFVKTTHILGVLT